MKQKGGVKIVCQNRKASHDFHLEERIEVGIALLGTEVKSLRQGKGSLVDAYAMPYRGEIFLHHFHIPEYTQGNQFNHEPMRKRKLLLHKAEILKLEGKVQKSGYTLVPTQVYLKDGKIKIELALARGKTKGDRRESSKEREARRTIDRALKGSQRRKGSDS
jgi:SsrA-binding protein